ncbi:MAG TPA: hypothetical protein PKD76_05190 [Solirubrobacterales bacterium]|nr:hypothetical protein [Solirubrobacterales bacterium]
MSFSTIARHRAVANATEDPEVPSEPSGFDGMDEAPPVADATELDPEQSPPEPERIPEEMAVLSVHHEDRLLAEVRAELGGELAEHGESQHTAGGWGATSIEPRQKDATYLVTRLRRDNPDLAAQVQDGELLPNATAIKAGIRGWFLARFGVHGPRFQLAESGYSAN